MKNCLWYTKTIKSIRKITISIFTDWTIPSS